MSQWLEKLNQLYSVWMQGRYGKDELNQFLILVTLLPIFISFFVPEALKLALIPAGLALYRNSSKDYVKRRKERDIYIRTVEDTVQWLKVQERRWNDRKTHRYFTCEHCKVVFRVPKGKGNIEVTCPKCGDKKIRKS